MLNKNYKLKIVLILFVLTLLLFLSYLLQSHFGKNKNSLKPVTESSVIENNLENISAINEATNAAKNQFLEMKDNVKKITNINDALAISQKYFTTNLQTKIKQNLTDNLSEEEKLNLFWQTVKGNVSLIEDITEVTATTIDESHVKLVVETKFTILELILVWENNAWRYNGEEKITHIIDEVGKTYKVVTKNEAEYEIITDKNGKEIFRLMKDGQAILDDIASTSAATVINK